jgi:hypothetical protein
MRTEVWIPTIGSSKWKWALVVGVIGSAEGLEVLLPSRILIVELPTSPGERLLIEVPSQQEIGIEPRESAVTE